MTGDSFGHLIFVTRISNEEQPNMTKCGSTYRNTSYTNTKEKQTKIVPVKDFWGSQNTVLVRAEPVLSGEWRCLLSIILQFSPRDCLGPRLAGIESLTLTVTSLWFLLSGHSLVWVTVMQRFVSSINSNVLIFKWVSFLVSDTWLCLRYVTFLYSPASLFRVIFPYFKYKYYNCIFFRLFIQ